MTFELLAAAGEAAPQNSFGFMEAMEQGGIIAWSILAVLVIMFYMLLIRPQQKRFQAHKEMLGALKKGDKVVTSGGLVGKIDKLADDDEVIVDLGNGVKVTALLHTIQAKAEKPATKEDKK